MIYKNWVSKKLSYVLSIWAGSLAMMIGLLGGKTPSVVFVRSAVGFILFGILGYVAGWIIYRVMSPELAFMDEDEENDEDENGEAMEGI
jgi:hypothetical protein